MAHIRHSPTCFAEFHSVLRRMCVAGMFTTLTACGSGGGSTPAGNDDPTGNNVGPVATITASSIAGTTPLAVQLSAAGSTDADGTLSTFEWDFGDNNQSSGREVEHTYTRVGSFTAVLTVTDNQGATGSAQTIITVSDPAALSEAAGTADITAALYLLLGNK